MVEQNYFRRDDGLPWTAAIEDWRLRGILAQAFQNVHDEQKVIDVGHSAIGFVILNGPAADDYFEIGGRVYCYTPTGGVPYDVAIAGLDEAATVTAINDDVDRTVDAYNAGGGKNLVLLVAKEGGVEGNGIALAESTGGLRLTLRAGSMQEGKDEYQRKICTVAFDFNAEDIAALAAGEIVPVMGIPSENTPEVGSASALRSGNIYLPLTAAVKFHVQQVNGHFWTVQVEDGGPLFQAGDVLLLLVWV